MALCILPRLMNAAREKNGLKEDLVILTATSGDTGKAALAGFADAPHTKIIVFYPDGGVSELQRLQMVTQRGGNVRVCAVRGILTMRSAESRQRLKALSTKDWLQAAPIQ